MTDPLRVPDFYVHELGSARGRVEQPLWPEIEFEPWGSSKAQFDPSLTDAEQIVRQTPWIDTASAIARPTLLVTGGRDDEVLVGPLSRQRLADTWATTTSRSSSSRGPGTRCAGTVPTRITRSWIPGSGA